MFTDEDYKEYLESIIALENQMIFFTDNLCHRIEDVGIAGKILEVLKDETRHYGMGRGLYFTFFPEKSVEAESVKSVFTRGTVTLTGSKGEKINSYLLSYTPQIIGIECDQSLEKGVSYEVEIKLNDVKSTERKKGEVAWFEALPQTRVNIASIRLK